MALVSDAILAAFGALVKTGIMFNASRVHGTFQDIVVGADPAGVLDDDREGLHVIVGISEKRAAVRRAVLPAGPPALGPAGYMRVDQPRGAVYPYRAGSGVGRVSQCRHGQQEYARKQENQSNTPIVHTYTFFMKQLNVVKC
jgi:hypothetical protein